MSGEIYGSDKAEQKKQGKTKTCSICKKTKSVSEFNKGRARKDGLQCYCKDCQQAKEKARRKRNSARNKNKAVNPNIKKRCPDCGEVKTAGEFRRNRTKKDGLQTACKGCMTVRNSKWLQDNPDKVRAKSHRRRARKANAEGSFTADEWKYTLKVLGYRCIYCGVHKDDTPEKWLEADHVVPLSRGGNNYIDNIVPACKSCNCSKGTKTLEEFLDAQKEV